MRYESIVGDGGEFCAPRPVNEDELDQLRQMNTTVKPPSIEMMIRKVVGRDHARAALRDPPSRKRQSAAEHN